MISYIKGTLAEKTPARITIEAGGLGYGILIPLSSYDSLGEVGSEVTVRTHFHVREDSHQLFGFVTFKELRLFEMLIAVSGIGPRSALTILSGAGVDDFCDAIVREEVAFLTTISGVGKKTAQRLIVELKSRISEEDARLGEGGGPASRRDNVVEAIEALIALGFKRPAARKAVEQSIDGAKGDASVEELIRGALRHT